MEEIKRDDFTDELEKSKELMDFKQRELVYKIQELEYKKEQLAFQKQLYENGYYSDLEKSQGKQLIKNNN